MHGLHERNIEFIFNIYRLKIQLQALTLVFVRVMVLRRLMNQSIMVCISLWTKGDRYILCLEKMGECKAGQPTDGGD
ncbi:hypothetical protein [Xenorhabdus koppenhoeferi]|uniref:hypothetical protein n=1 Tax=Xenorhabdus koppenhoeferi TaxID=351659 RepID=UPI002B406CC6|nr:hypothetical protein [Xenorhabdus sp. Vera]